MIYIDVSRINISEEWREKARRVTEELRNIPAPDRARFIERNSEIWQSVKSELERISHNKCWYCEVKSPRADFHIDHHRPKNRVKNPDGTEEPGYWWLAFDPTNFRIACSYCNCPHTGEDGFVKGKSDQFPLPEGSIRASSPNSNLNDENPILLDPTNPSDPSLLWFLDDGRTCPRHSEAVGFLHRRAKETIDILNLNDIKIIEERKKLWRRCISLIELGDRAFDQYQRESSTGRIEFEIIIREIRELIQSSAEFSATARTCFRGSRYDWVRETVQ